MSDEDLLREYVRGGSYAAFSQLMKKHLPMVFAVCLRETGERTSAEDATQAVFLVLARKAKELRSGKALPCWLYRTARLAAKRLRQRDRLRKQREAELVPPDYPAERAPDMVCLILDEAIESLNSRERDAILLRYFTGLSISETAAHLGISEGAAQMRISRALDKLHRFLTKRSADVTAIGLAALLLSMSDREASAHLLARSGEIVGAAQTGSVALNISIRLLAQGVIRTMAITRLKIAAACCSALAVTGIGVGAFALPRHHLSPLNRRAVRPVTQLRAAAQPGANEVVVLDPGHGGNDPGGTAPDGSREKDLNLVIAEKAEALLGQKGFVVYLTRTDDSPLAIDARVRFAQAHNAALFVSIHCDMEAATDPRKGAEVYYHGHTPADRGLANTLSQGLDQATGHTNLGTASDEIRFPGLGFGVLRGQSVPCALVQCGRMSNPVDLKYLESDPGQNAIAAGIAGGVASYSSQTHAKSD